MNGLEGVGEAVTGGMIARAVEPHAGEGDGHTHETACLNCGTRLAGDYCHRCGQHAHVHRTLGAFWHDVAHSVLHFEGKIWRTLPLLALKPGVLTRRYIAGERARFVSPMALFLFSVFLMFAVFSWAGGPVHIGGGNTANNFQNGMQEAVAEGESQIRATEKLREMTIAQGNSPAALDIKLKEKRDEVSLLRQMQSQGVTEATLSRAGDDITGPDWFRHAYKKAKANPSLLLYKLQNNAYKFSWALIPISVPFMWLLFPFSRRFRLYDHTVFVTYSLCFMTLLTIALSLLVAVGFPGGLSILVMLLIPPVHMYKQLRGAYGLSRWSGAWRTILLLHFASWAALLFSGLLLYLGVV